MTNTPPFWWPVVGQGFLASNFEEYLSTVNMCEHETKAGPFRPEFLHNTAIPTFAQWHMVSGIDRMKNLEHYYRDVLKWTAGPHLFVADDLIWVHSPSWNRISWGVELVGEYNSEPLLSTVKRNAIIAIAALCRKCSIAPDTLRLHHEDPLTTHKGCPGRNVVKDDFIQGIREQMQ